MSPAAVLALSALACTEAQDTSGDGLAGSSPPWSVASEPRTVIGMLEEAEEYQFAAISAAARQSDGDIVVADEGSRTVRLYGPEGRYRATLGSEGAGPGEFARPTQVMIGGADSVIVWDDATFRFSVFDSAGGFIRDHTFDRSRIAVAAAPPMYPGSGRLLSSGELLVRLIEKSGKIPPQAGESNRFRPRSGALRVSADARHIDTVAFFGDGEKSAVDSPWGRLALDPPLPRNTWIAVQPNEARLCIGDQDQPGISCYEADGTVTTVSWPLEPAPVPGDDPDVEQWRSRTLAEYELKLSRDASLRLVEQMPPPTERPPHSRLVLDREGYLWVTVGPADDGAHSQHMVFDREGAFVTGLSLPRMRMLDIGSHEIVAAYRDELDVQYLGVFEIRKETE